MTGWHAVAIEGAETALRSIIVELMMAHPDEPATLVAADVGVDPASLPWTGHHAVLVPDTLLGPFTHTVMVTAELRIAAQRAIADASFDFEAAAASRQGAAAIRATLRSPGDVRMTAHAEHEEEQASARDGVGVRRYVFRTHGRVEGPVPGVLAFRRRLADVNATGTLRLRLA